MSCWTFPNPNMALGHRLSKISRSSQPHSTGIVATGSQFHGISNVCALPSGEASLEGQSPMMQWGGLPPLPEPMLLPSSPRTLSSSLHPLHVAPPSSRPPSRYAMYPDAAEGSEGPNAAHFAALTVTLASAAPAASPRALMGMIARAHVSPTTMRAAELSFHFPCRPLRLQPHYATRRAHQHHAT